MPKKRKAKKENNSKASQGNPPKGDQSKPVATKTPKERPQLRAIRVDDQLLEAVKDYKKSTGISLYTLGYEAVRDRLIKEGFLKPTTPVKA